MARIGIVLIVVALIAGMGGCVDIPVDIPLFSLTVYSIPGGDVTAPGLGTFTYRAGTVVSLNAIPGACYQFAGWVGNVGTVADVNAATTNITMKGGYFITALFAPRNVEIRTWYDLDDVRNNRKCSYILMNDLDSTTAGYDELAGPTADSGKGWYPISEPEWSFTGSLDGQGYEISDLFINRPGQNFIGLFGELSAGGIVQNIGVTDVTISGRDVVGGLVGRNEYGSVSNCHCIGNVSGDESVGGLVGINRGSVDNSCFTGSVTGNSSVGGLAGMTIGDFVSNCYAAGSVTGKEQVGGLAGYDDYSPVINSYSIGDVTGNSDVGGLIGSASSSGLVIRSFWDTETSGQNTSAGGTGLNTTQMQDIATFLGASWNITTVALNETNLAYIWNIVNNVAYPFLSWQPVS